MHMLTHTQRGGRGRESGKGERQEEGLVRGVETETERQRHCSNTYY